MPAAAQYVNIQIYTQEEGKERIPKSGVQVWTFNGRSDAERALKKYLGGSSIGRSDGVLDTDQTRGQILQLRGTYHGYLIIDDGFEFTKAMPCQDLHIGLVWRMRSIKNKVDLSLVDDYAKKVDRFKERQRREAWIRDSILVRNGEIRDSIEKRRQWEADSTQYWDWYHTRRLKAARILKSDTVFSGRDMMLDMKLLKGIKDPKALKKALGKKNKGKKK